jgi:hypothetical protein
MDTVSSEFVVPDLTTLIIDSVAAGSREATRAYCAHTIDYVKILQYIRDEEKYEFLDDILAFVDPIGAIIFPVLCDIYVDMKFKKLDVEPLERKTNLKLENDSNICMVSAACGRRGYTIQQAQVLYHISDHHYESGIISTDNVDWFQRINYITTRFYFFRSLGQYKARKILESLPNPDYDEYFVGLALHKHHEEIERVLEFYDGKAALGEGLKCIVQGASYVDYEFCYWLLKHGAILTDTQKQQLQTNRPLEYNRVFGESV